MRQEDPLISPKGRRYFAGFTLGGHAPTIFQTEEEQNGLARKRHEKESRLTEDERAALADFDKAIMTSQDKSQAELKAELEDTQNIEVSRKQTIIDELREQTISRT